jgi:hypothetical protein
MTSITISESVRSIGIRAIAYAQKLTSISVDERNTTYVSVDGILFSRDKTVLVQYPAGRTGAYIIPDGVTDIGDGAFNGCQSLTSITIPAGVATIGEEAFNQCVSLTSIDLPGSITTIGGDAFRTCSGLTSVTIPDGVVSIGGASFLGCENLTSVTIPGSVTNIGVIAFAYCTALADVFVGWPAPFAINEYVFENTPIASATLHVPAGTKALYEEADVWKDFGTITEGSSSSVPPISPNTYIYYEQGILTVYTPAAEQIAVYSATGQLLYRAQKAAGEAVYRIDRLQRGVLIIQGSSGWVKKIVR